MQTWGVLIADAYSDSTLKIQKASSALGLRRLLSDPEILRSAG
jgi:hypothetical protein